MRYSEAFPPEDRFQRIYDLASAAMHGRTSRGIELLQSAAVGDPVGDIGVLVLERLCNPDESLSPTFAAAIISKQLDHAERFGVATSDRMAQQVLGRIEEPLTHGVDFGGEGTSEDPFRIAAHLQFHAGSYALLAQLGVNVEESKRVLSLNEKGRLCDRWESPDRDVWFEVLINETME